MWILAGLLAAAALFAAAGSSRLADVSAKSGVTAKLENGAQGGKRLIETMTGGVALFDHDGDGLLDLYLANGAELPSLKKTRAGYWNRLYRNRGGGRFEDVTARAGVAGSGYDMGVAAADYDNDGHPDLFVAGVRGNTLFRNRGDGTFEDVTAKAGLAGDTKWAVGAGWFDLDNDGRLDLFVVRYVDWDPAKEPSCGDPVRAYCHPRNYAPLANLLYRNEGNGVFRDVSRESGIAAHAGKGMAVAFGDANQDQRLDIFVTNDTEPNFLFLNLGGGKFEEAGGPGGVAFNGDGRALSSMGADFRDWDNDGREDLYLTALTNETFPLFRALGGGRFLDRTYTSLVGRATLDRAGWSAGIHDFDNDGWKDLFAACADVQDNTESYSGRESRQRNLLLLNQQGRTFRRIDAEGPPALHRGAAFGDLDGDGAIDAVVSRIGEPPLVLRNELAQGNHWIALRLRGTRGNREGLGAWVELRTARGKQWNRASTAVGYASSSSPLVHFGLGGERAIEEIVIRWPSGIEQRIARPPVDRYLDAVEP